MIVLLALLPVATLALATVALRPSSDDAPQPLRLAIVRSAVAVAAATVIGVELLALPGWISLGPITAFWVLLTVTAAVLAGARLWRDRARLRARLGARLRLGRHGLAVGLLVGVPVAVLVGAELVLAVASAPNNYDSNHYHLAKIEHWIASGNVDIYATSQTQQVTLLPGGEFLLLQLRLLSGGDHLANLLQWSAGLLGAVALSRCAAQLGAGRLGQWLAAALFLTVPAIVLEATSTQNDLLLSAWVACAATVALDGARRKATLGDVLGLSGAAGLVFVTKSTGLMALVALLVYWALSQLRQRPFKGQFKRIVYGGLAVTAAIALLAGPSLLRVQNAFGSPFGPPGYRTALSTERQDPPAVLVNGLRLAASTLLTPLEPVNDAVADGVLRVAGAVGVNPNDPAITQWRSVFPDDRWKPDEDRSPYPIQSALILLATVVGLLLRRTRGYALAVMVALVLTAAVVKWQYWGNRLILPAFVLGVPLAAVWLEKLATRAARPTATPAVSTPAASTPAADSPDEADKTTIAPTAAPARRVRPVGAALVALVMAASFTYAYGCVLYGQPRRLAGPGSVFTIDEWQQRFARQPYVADGYRAAIDQVKASGAERVGLVMEGDMWEYPFQISLKDVQLVELTSEVPSEPPANVATVDAVICVSSPERCHSVVPADWRYQQIDGVVATAFPP